MEILQGLLMDLVQQAEKKILLLLIFKMIFLTLNKCKHSKNHFKLHHIQIKERASWMIMMIFQLLKYKTAEEEEVLQEERKMKRAHLLLLLLKQHLF